MKKSIPLIDLKLQHRAVQSETRRALQGVFSSQRFVLGGHVEDLEKRIAKKLGSRHGIGLASGTDALYLTLLALGIGPGDEVITTPFTFFASASSISRTGARPVFSDIDPETFNIDPERIASRVSRRTKAILPVHLFGLPCDMDPILSLARKRGLFVVEDAAQSFGAEYQGRKIGGIGDASALSFYPTKNLGGAGDGGMAVTSSAALAAKLRRLRDHGQTKKYFHKEIGFNSRLDEIQAAVLQIKLKHIDTWNGRRAGNAAFYGKALRDLPLKLPVVPAGSLHTFHLYSVRTPRRDALARFLRSRGIGCGVYYPLPLHLQPCYRDLGYKRGDLPESERASKEVLSLPMYAELSKSALERVAQSLREFFR